MHSYSKGCVETSRALGRRVWIRILLYAETSSPRVPGDLFTLAHDGSTCSGTGLGVSTVAFHYHMYTAPPWASSA